MAGAVGSRGVLDHPASGVARPNAAIYDETVKLRRDGLIWRRAGDEVIALDLTRSEYMASNASGAVVWEALADGAHRDSLVERLCAEFDVDAEVAGADVDSLLAWLRNEGLLEEDPPTPRPSKDGRA